MVIKITKDTSKEELQAILAKLEEQRVQKKQAQKELALKELFGSMKFDRDPLVIQQEMRNEW